MKSKALNIILLSVIFALVLPNFSNAQTYSYTLTTVQVVNGNNLEVTLHITNKGVPFELAYSEFVITANPQALDLDLAGYVKNSGTIWEKGRDYFQTTATGSNAAGIATAIVRFKNNNHAQLGNTILKGSTQTIGTILIPFTDSSASVDISWDTAATKIRMVDWRATPAHPDITTGAIFSTPPPASLPTELISFIANNRANHVKLIWATVSEKNNSHFDVERSNNGITWERISTINGHGNSSTIKNYTSTDYDIFSGRGNEIIFYRLRQTDYSGGFMYSNVRSVSSFGNSSPPAVTLSPNPAAHKAEITLKSYTGTFSATIINTSGRQVGVYQGSNRQVLVPVNHLKSGIYIVKITSETGQPLGSQKLVINR